MENISFSKRWALECERNERNKQIKEHKLSQLFWECTVRCNQNCLHCGGDCRKLPDVSDMPIQNFCRVLDDIARHQDPSSVIIVITGGEPLLRDDLEECGREITKRGFKWCLVTNGILLTPERYQSLQDAGMHSISISLDGFDVDHNWLHGCPESFEKTCEAIRLVNTVPSMVCEVVTCVTNRNIDYLPEMAGLLLNLGVERWRLYSAYPIGRAAQNPELQLEPYQIRWLLKFICKQREARYMYVNYGCEGFLGKYEGEVRDHLFSCQAGISIASIKVNGEIGGCLSINKVYSQGNIYEDEFMDIWNTCYRQYRNRDWMHTGICTHCRQFRYCHGGSFHLRDEENRLIRCTFYNCK